MTLFANICKAKDDRPEPPEENHLSSAGLQAVDLLCNCGFAAQLKHESNAGVNANVSGGPVEGGLV